MTPVVLSIDIPSIFNCEASGDWPMATTTWSASIMKSVPGIGSGLCRPFGIISSVNLVCWQRIPVTLTPSPRISTGMVRYSIDIPSFSASSTSSSEAVSSSWTVQLSILTVPLFLLIAALAESMAAFPSPMITMFEPTNVSTIRFKVNSSDMQSTTPSSSSPGMLSLLFR